MFSNTATENNIDSYCTKYGTQKDVDVLITYFNYTEQNAIAASKSRGSDYLTKISFEASDYAIIVPIELEVNIESVENAIATICGSSRRHSLTSARGLSWGITKITFACELTVNSL